jgi:hypothetical protein
MAVADVLAEYEARDRLIDELNAGLAVRVPKDGRALDLLRAVYANEGLPLPVRMRAAIAALPFETPKLAVTATVPGGGFADLLAARIRRIAEAKQLTIDATPEPGAPAVPDRRRA